MKFCGHVWQVLGISILRDHWMRTEFHSSDERIGTEAWASGLGGSNVRRPLTGGPEIRACAFDSAEKNQTGVILKKKQRRPRFVTKIVHSIFDLLCVLFVGLCVQPSDYCFLLPVGFKLARGNASRDIRDKIVNQSLFERVMQTYSATWGTRLSFFARFCALSLHPAGRVGLRFVLTDWAKPRGGRGGVSVEYTKGFQTRYCIPLNRNKKDGDRQQQNRIIWNHVKCLESGKIRRPGAPRALYIYRVFHSETSDTNPLTSRENVVSPLDITSSNAAVPMVRTGVGSDSRTFDRCSIVIVKIEWDLANELPLSDYFQSRWKMSTTRKQ